MTNNYSFNVEYATEFGVNEAILINNFQFWIQKNKANNTNFFDGKYWTYNSVEAFATLFPFWSQKQIRTTIESLLSQGVIVKGNYNKDKHNRTAWYAFADEERFLSLTKKKQDHDHDTKKENAFAQTGTSICPNGQMDLPKKANVYSTTDINTDVNTDITLGCTDGEGIMAHTKNETSATTQEQPPSPPPPPSSTTQSTCFETDATSCPSNPFLEAKDLSSFDSWYHGKDKDFEFQRWIAINALHKRDIDGEKAKFVEYYRAIGKNFDDYKSLFRYWLLKSKDKANAPPSPIPKKQVAKSKNDHILQEIWDLQEAKEPMVADGFLTTTT
jgi:hypothetical protein